MELTLMTNVVRWQDVAITRRVALGTQWAQGGGSGQTEKFLWMLKKPFALLYRTRRQPPLLMTTSAPSDLCPCRGIFKLD